MNRAELADFLRRRRARVEPADVGLPVGVRRRIAGLRREEVAALAGMSTDYYVRLEQARSPQPSPQLLLALSRALRLSEDERDHIFHLSGHEPPSRMATSGMVRVGLLPVLDQLTQSAATVFSDLGVTLAQNFLSRVLLGRHERARSFYLTWFLDSDGRDRVPADDHAHLSRVHVADLRATAARRAVDPQVARMVRRLRTGSDEFRRLWDEHQVAVRRSDRKRFIHPSVGVVEVDCEVLLTPEHDQRLVVYSARPGTEAHNQLQLLRVIGLQDMGGPEPDERQPVAAGAADADYRPIGVGPTDRPDDRLDSRPRRQTGHRTGSRTDSQTGHRTESQTDSRPSDQPGAASGKGRF
jgi:transcriptional regulator with XRE-family HTH domain